MLEPLVSIITPTYNCGSYIGETIESVLKQDYQNWEMIIVDDCSVDDTKKVVERHVMQDRRIQYYRLDVNCGPAVARTRAMEIARGKYIAFLDSDDLWMPLKLSKQVSYMQDNNVAFSCTDYEQISEDGYSLGRIIKARRKADYDRVLLDCPVGNSTVVYDVEKMGKFVVPNVRKSNDYALWLQMLKKEKYIYGIPEVLMKYRKRSNSVSSNKLDMVRFHWSLYRELEHLSVMKSIFHVGYWGVIKVLKIK